MERKNQKEIYYINKAEDNRLYNNKIPYFTVSIVIVFLIIQTQKILWPNHFGTDSSFMLNMFLSMSEGKLAMPIMDGWLRLSEYSFLHGIMNAIIHTGTLKMLGTENWYWATKLPMLFIICGLNMFLYIFGKRYLPPLSLFILILLVCFDATVINYSTSLRSDICLMTFYSISALSLYGYFKENNKKYLFGSGIAAGFTMLTFMQGIPILPSAVVCLLVANDNFKKAILESALFISTVLAVMSPYLIWIFVDETRTEIFILQHNFASHHDDPLLIAIGKALCVPFSSMWGNGRSFTSLFVIASILFSLANIREKEGRFWLSLLFIGTLMLCTAHSVNCRRIMMLTPLACFCLLLAWETNSRLLCKCLIISATGILFAYIIGKHLFPLLRWNWVILSLGIFPLLYIICQLINKAIQGSFMIQNGMRIVFIGLIFVSIVLQILPIFNTRGYTVFSRSGIELISTKFMEKFNGEKLTIIARSNLFPLFPENVSVRAQSLLTYHNYYNYFESYEYMTKSINADYILLTNNDVIKREPAGSYIKNNFVLIDIIDCKPYSTYYLYKKI